MSEKSELTKYLEEHVKAVQDFSVNNNLELIVNLICKAFTMGNTLYAFGNGGSAADASHFVAELIGRFENGHRTAYKAICLNTDVAVMTAIANDYGYINVFQRQVVGLVVPGDVVIGFSTSGNSDNVNSGIFDANLMGALTIGFTGANTDNHLARNAHISLVVPSTRTCIIQEIHQLAIHYIAQEVEKILK